MSISLEKIAFLKPTQVAVGYREVRAKSQKLVARGSRDGGAVTQKRLIPVIAGPSGHIYLRDGHHLALALHLAGHESVFANIVADFSDLGMEAFWRVLEERNWVRPFDGNGRRKQFRHMPSSILDVEDDPLRSLAGALRRRGGFAKSTLPYADFAWADFLRDRIDPDLLAHDFPATLALAQNLAASCAADQLPGWLAPNPRADIAPVPVHAS